MGSVPGVAGSGLSLIAPLSGRLWHRQVHVSGSWTSRERTPHAAVRNRLHRPAKLTPTEPYTALNAVTPGWMAAMGVSVRAGRDLADADRVRAPRVAIVNEMFVAQVPA